MTYIDSVSEQDPIRDIEILVNNILFNFDEISNDNTNKYQCCCVDCNNPATHHHNGIQNHVIGSYCESCKKRLEAYSLDDEDKSFKKITIKRGKLKK